MSLVAGYGREEFKGRLQVLPDLAHGRHIRTTVAVIWRAPYCHHVLIVEMILVSFIDELMRTRDKCEVVDLAEFICNFASE